MDRFLSMEVVARLEGLEIFYVMLVLRLLAEKEQ